MESQADDFYVGEFSEAGYYQYVEEIESDVVRNILG